MKCLWVLLLAAKAFAVEPLGHLEIRDVLLRPSFSIKEPSNGEFSIGESSLAFGWRRDETFSSFVLLGERTLLNQPAIFTPLQNPDDLTFVEAYAQIEGPYGRFRIGRIPIDYGGEGELRESELMFPRSYLFSRGVSALRDLGMSFAIRNNGFFTRLAIHQGEVAKNLDGRMWYTAAWGWSDEEQFEIGVMGTTGRTSPLSTLGSTSTLANFDPTLSSKWTMWGLFAKYHPKDFKILGDVTIGQNQQNGSQNFTVGHLDLAYDISSNFSVQTRFDGYNPHSSTNEFAKTFSLGTAYRSDHDTTVIYLIASKRWELEQSTEFRLILRLTPLPSTTLF